MIKFILTLVLLSIWGHSPSVRAAEAYIAVASNFTQAIKALAKQFQTQHDDKLILSFGGTGKFYAQILNGAPFDAFFAADIRRPKLLEQQGFALPDSRFTYAQGKIVLFSPKADYVDAAGAILTKRTYHYLAIANPKLAPYGEAAKQVLEKLGLWETLHSQLVRGENIGQAYQFVMSGNAELGFVALSQISAFANKGSHWEVPDNLYEPIQQQAVLLSHNPVAKAFIEFVQSDEAKVIIQNFGYEVPKR
jgi:molybdate transport system substrate-binding protein